MHDFLKTGIFISSNFSVGAGEGHPSTWKSLCYHSDSLVLMGPILLGKLECAAQAVKLTLVTDKGKRNCYNDTRIINFIGNIPLKVSAPTS